MHERAEAQKERGKEAVDNIEETRGGRSGGGVKPWADTRSTEFFLLLEGPGRKRYTLEEISRMERTSVSPSLRLIASSRGGNRGSFYDPFSPMFVEENVLVEGVKKREGKEEEGNGNGRVKWGEERFEVERKTRWNTNKEWQFGGGKEKKRW